MKYILGYLIATVEFLLFGVVFYCLFMLFGWLPKLSIIFGSQALPYQTLLMMIFFILGPIGNALFITPILADNNLPSRIMSYVGMALMIIPTLVLQIIVMSALNENFYEFCSSNEATQRAYYGLFPLFFYVTSNVAVRFSLIGKDQYFIESGFDDGLHNMGPTLNYVYFSYLPSFVLMFIIWAVGESGAGIVSLIAGFVPLIAILIMRLKNGSPFQC